MAVSPLPASLRGMSLIDWALYGMLAVAAFAVTQGIAGQDVDDFVYSFRRGNE